ncbi:MAG TPA: BCCT family transporter [Flavobacteriaceae bacterium]|nr:BCCT family transporter [Flavobacteriaceae bacterium]
MSKYVRNKHFVANKVVFFVSLALILLLILIGVAFPEAMNEKLNNFRVWSSDSFGWFFVLSVNVILIFSIYIAFSKYGKIRLGGSDARPAYSKASWFAMLFSAGMGIGIMFYSIGEPVTHFGTPPLPVASDLDAAKQAMEFTSLHYGLHVWAIYALVGLALAFFAYNKNLPMTFRSAFYPFIGDKINGGWGRFYRYFIGFSYCIWSCYNLRIGSDASIYRT